MNIVADKNQPLVDEYFGSLGRVIKLSAEEITNRNLKKYDADVLICRSTIKINRDLLTGTKIKYVGTCTIGYDHADLGYLRENRIGFDSAPGCNSASVGEYLTAVLLKLALKYNLELSAMTIGIIGVGNVGKEVAKKARALGLNVLLNDPPRARNEGDTEFTSLTELLQQSDIVTIHVPLILDGQDKTIGMIDDDFIDKMKDGAFFCNASRGRVAPDCVISRGLSTGKIQEAIIDVFATEPVIDSKFVQKLFISTQHISGHSIDGKINGTKIIYRKLCSYFNLPVSEKILDIQLEPENNIIVIPDKLSGLRAIEYAVDSCYNIFNDSRKLKENPDKFASLRKNYPLRFEFPHYRIICNDPQICSTLYRLGFKENSNENISANFTRHARSDT